MRTVHETEALRPSDPVPKNHNPPNGSVSNQSTLRRITLKMGGAKSTSSNPDLPTLPTDHPGHIDMDSLPLDLPPWPADLQFTSTELALPPSQMFRLLRRQLHWAEQERDQLRAEMNSLEHKREVEWKRTQQIIDDVLSKETDEYQEQIRKGEVAPMEVGYHDTYGAGRRGPDDLSDVVMRSVSRSRSPMPFDH